MSLWVDVIPNWITAFGTLGAVLVALFYRPVLNWIRRPKFEIKVGARAPFLDRVSVSTSSSNSDKEIILRFSLLNRGKATAEHCYVNIDSYYYQRKDGVCLLNPILPIELKSYKNASIKYIPTNLEYWLDFASIRKEEGLGTSDSSQRQKQFFRLFLLGNDSPYKLGKGAFIIPIKINSTSIKKTAIFYVKVYWDSDELTTEQQNFSVETISYEQFKSLKIE